MTEEKKPKKAPPEHKDKLGKLISLDNFVAYPQHNDLAFGKVVKINPKMIGVAKISKVGNWRMSSNKYPQDMIVLDPAQMTWYILKNG